MEKKHFLFYFFLLNPIQQSLQDFWGKLKKKKDGKKVTDSTLDGSVEAHLINLTEWFVQINK